MSQGPLCLNLKKSPKEVSKMANRDATRWFKFTLKPSKSQKPLLVGGNILCHNGVIQLVMLVNT